jgi:hypothetical protein
MDYENYYKTQAHEKIPVFKGANYQKGYGFGDVFKRFFKWIVPVIKKHAAPVVATVGKEALKSGINIANDALDGKDFVESSRKRIKDSLNNLSEQYGKGKIKKKRLIKGYKLIGNKIKKVQSKKKQGKRKLDIFD